jgi:transposase
MNCRLTLTAKLRMAVYQRLQPAYDRGQIRLIKRIHALLAVVDGKSLSAVAGQLQLSEQTLRNYLTAFILKGLDSLAYRRPPGRPAKLTQTQRKELADLLDAGPEKAGYEAGGWNTGLIQDLILTRFKAEYTPRCVAELLQTLGFSWQKARFVSDHLADVAPAQQTWSTQTWPEIQAVAKQKHARVLFGA